MSTWAFIHYPLDVMTPCSVHFFVNNPGLGATVSAMEISVDPAERELEHREARTLPMPAVVALGVGRLFDCVRRRDGRTVLLAIDLHGWRGVRVVLVMLLRRGAGKEARRSAAASLVLRLFWKSSG